MKTLFYGNHEMYESACKVIDPSEFLYCKDFEDAMYGLELHKRYGVKCQIVNLDSQERKFDESRIAYNKGEITLEELIEKYNLVK